MYVPPFLHTYKPHFTLPIQTPAHEARMTHDNILGNANSSLPSYRYEPCETSILELETYYAGLRAPKQNRLNLYIPELGLFIVSDKLTCAVFSITVFRDRKNGRDRDIYGFRREYILPFQEENFVPQVNVDSHPEEKILGIAAAPLQGEMDRTSTDDEVDEDWGEYVEHPRVWRLFLCMRSREVFVYELSRTKTDWKPPGVELFI
jgi:hypothetical protein